MHMIQKACNLRYKDAYTSCYICHAKCKKCTKESYTYATKKLPHTQLKKSNTHQAPPANNWKLLDLGVWWKYRLVGHVWVHGSRLSFLSLRCLSENDTSLLCAWFWSGALGSLQRLSHVVPARCWFCGVNHPNPACRLRLWAATLHRPHLGFQAQPRNCTRLHLAFLATMRPALDPTGHRVPRTKPTCLLHTWRPHRQRPFTLVLHLHQHESSRNLHLQYSTKS
jgi:hypothetical protein